jgi:hypothetical protein
MSDRDMKVLGYVAQKLGTPEAVCDGDSCLIAGSERKMNEYIKAFSNSPSTSYFQPFDLFALKIARSQFLSIG